VAGARSGKARLSALLRKTAERRAAPGPGRGTARLLAAPRARAPRSGGGGSRDHEALRGSALCLVTRERRPQGAERASTGVRGLTAAATSCGLRAASRHRKTAWLKFAAGSSRLGAIVAAAGRADLPACRSGGSRNGA